MEPSSYLTWNFPIVDPKTGFPTPDFMRLFQANTNNIKGAVESSRQILTTDGLEGGGDLSEDRTLSLTNTGVTPGSYVFGSFTVDINGRLLSAASGSPVTQVNTGTGLTGGPITSTGTISLANTSVTPGSYTNANITVDAQGRLTAASNGSGGGGGSAWTIVSATTISSPVATIDVTGLGAFNEILIVFDLVTASASGIRQVRVSTDNGATFFSASGDYSSIAASFGAKTALTAFTIQASSTAVAVSGAVHIHNSRTASKKWAFPGAAQLPALFEASTSPINAIRCLTSSGNLTGGTITVFAR